MRKEVFTPEEMREIRSAFDYVDVDVTGQKRIFMDNAGGSLRLKRAEEEFARVDSIPDCSEHSNRVAMYLLDIENKGLKDIKEVIFGAKNGVIYPSYSASQIMMELCRVFSANAKGTNVVTTMLEHPSAFDGLKYYAEQYGREFRVAGVNKQSGGVDADTIISLVDENTAILSCMYASNISGYVYDVEKVFREARKKNPDILIICDAVQHAPHAWLDPEALGVDAMHFAPYKFFGIRGFSAAWISDRAASFMHHRLLGKAADDWNIGSPAPAHYAALTEIVNYVAGLGAKKDPSVTDRKELFRIGMDRIAAHERYLLDIMLEGTDEVPGLRHMKGVKVQMDGADIDQRDLIIGIEFEKISCVEAVEAYDRAGIVSFERKVESMYSKRMVEAFDSKGMVRLSPLHVNTKEEMEEFLAITKKMA